MKKARKLLSLVLCLVMVLSFFPAAYAEGEDEGTIAPVSEDAEEPIGADEPEDPVEDGAGGPEDDPNEPVGADAPGGPELEDPSTPLRSAQDDTGDGTDALPVEDDLQEVTASGSCGENLTWTLEDGVLTISGTGDMNDWDFEGSPWYDQRAQITTVILEPGVSNIGIHAFAFCSNLTSVAIPASVTSIRDYAFNGCTSLTSVTIPSSVTSIGIYAFAFCSGLTGVTIPERVSSIGASAFEGCSTLTSVEIPLGVTSIGDCPFANCSSLIEILVADGNNSFTSLDGILYNVRMDKLIQCPGAKNGAMTIPEGVTSIGNYAFSGCSYLTSVMIPAGVTEIGANAFSNCSSLRSVTIPEGVTSISPSTFWCCSSLSSITIPESVTSIGATAFYKCSSLTNVTIPEGVTAIESKTFYECSSLTNVLLPSSVTVIGYYAFFKCTGLWSVTIPDGVTKISQSAFSGCSKLRSVTIPASVTSIGLSAFTSCSNLMTIIFLGKAPSFQYDCFNKVTATAYYPDDDSWANKRGNYMGNLTWVLGTSNLSFNPTGGSVILSSKQVMYGAPYGELPTPERTGYVFEGWYTAAVGGEMVTGDMIVQIVADRTLYAHWTALAYTIGYDANGGTGAPAAQTKTYGVDLNLSSTRPTRSSSSAGSYTVTLDPNGGSVSSTRLSAARTESFSFAEWNTAADGSGDSYAPGAACSLNADTILYAQWNSSVSTSWVSLPTPSRTGYTFQGWAADPEAGSGVTGNYTPTNDVTLYAVWTINTYIVSYNAKGGSVAPASQTKTWGVDLVLSDMVPEAEGYDFLGWSLYNQSGIPDYQPGDIFTGNGSYDGEVINFYAVWQLKTYLVVYKSEGWVDVPVPQLKSHGRAITLSEEIPEREGYSFLGWSRDRKASEAEYQPGDRFTENGNTVLYAVWTPLTYTVSYDANGGEGAPEAQTKTHDVALTLQETVPTREPGGQQVLTVTLDPNGGSLSVSTLYTVGSASYAFESWNTAADGSGTGYAPGAEYSANESATLYAQWSESMTANPLLLPTPTREGYLFLGWAESRNALVGETGNYTPAGSVTLYAIWQKEPVESEAKLVVGSGSAGPGKEIRIPVNLEKNPGVVSVEVNVQYNEELLEWIGVEEGGYGGIFDGAVGKAVTWYAEDPREDVTRDDVLFTLVFRVKAGAADGITAVNLSYNENSIFNAAEENVEFQIVAGEIEILSYLPGDINGDGTVDNKDVTRLIRYLKYRDVEVVEAALDVNGDGMVNNKDVTRLIRFVKYGDVEIY